MQELFDAVREACGAALWSRGVELVRADAVTPERDDGDELAVRVTEPGELVGRIATLYPDDAEWECECPAGGDACVHVAAAVIAVRRARREGRSFQAAPSGRIRYRLDRQQDRLAFDREVETPEGPVALRTSVEALARGRVDGPRVHATSQDLAADNALAPHRAGILAPEVLGRVLRALVGHPDVRLDGELIEISDEPVGPIARLVDAPGGFRLYVEQDPAIREVFRNGPALCEGPALRPIAESGLSGRERAELPTGRFYADEQAAELVTSVLPDLRKRIPVRVDTDRLPDTSDREKPRLRLETERVGDRLSLLPTLVYGDPPLARVDAGRLVHLQGSVPVRDEPAETRLAASLRQSLGVAPGHRIELQAEDAVEMAARLADFPGEVVGRAHEAFRIAPDLVPRLQVEGDRLDLAFESGEEHGTSSGRPGSGADAGAVLRAWRSGESLVALPGGGFAALPGDWLARFGDRVADLLAARDDDDGRIPAAALPDLALLCDDLDEPRPLGAAELAPLVDGFEGIPPAPLPDDLRADLRAYQRSGIDWLCFLRDRGLGALLADDMGLGKTLQALTALRGRSLVVAPTSVLPNWSAEIRRFRPGLRVDLYHGPSRSLDAGADVTLTSYALLRLDAPALTREHWDCVVLDEAQNVKNPESQVAGAAFALDADFRLALTGTPVENRLDELWSQLHFLNPGLLGGRRDFEERYGRPIAQGDAEVAERLRRRCKPFVLRRLKREVAPELPSRTDVVLRCTLEPEERAVYDAVRAATVSQVVERLQAGGSVMAALEALLRLRQAACHPALVPGQAAESASSKLALLVDRLTLAIEEGHKALVFSQWTSLLDLVEPELEGAGLGFGRLDGRTRDRAGVVAHFQSRDGPPVLLASLKAGGTGLNLTAADHVFLLDPWWNPAVEDQAADRAHRIGQERPVLVHRLVAVDTVEERILGLQESKRALVEAALGEPGASAAGGLTRDDLLALLE